MELTGTNRKRKKKKKGSYSGSQRIFTRKYSDENVDRLKRLIRNHAGRGQERYFAIKVDGEFCVYKTSDPNSFDDYKEMVDGKTETVEVIMYFGRSNNCNRHLFYLKENAGFNGFNGMDVDRKIKEALEKKDQEHLMERLKEKVEEQDLYIQELEDELEELRSGTDLRGIIKEGIALIGTLKGNTNPDPGLAGTPQPEAEVEVEAEESGEPEKKNPNLSRQQQLYNGIYEQFGEKGVHQVVSLMMAIAKSDRLREGINQLIAEENLRKEKEKENPG